MARKAGLDSALDFTKFVITLDGALIAFVTGATFLQDISSGLEKAAALIALAALLVSIVAGIFVAMGVATMLSDGNYDLAAKPVSIPGIVNVIGFALGALAVAALAAFELFLEPPPAAAATKQAFEFSCRTGARAPVGPLNCVGSIKSMSH